MCTFNGENFLKAQLESIAAQVRLPQELVVCDDRSSDSTVEIVQDFARRAPFPVRLSINEENVGSTKNFEKAISLCTGDIVALADQDDIWYPHKLGVMTDAFARNSNTVASFSDANVVGPDSRSLHTRLWKTFGLSRSAQRQFAKGHGLNVLVKHPVVTGATMAFKKDLFRFVVPIPDEQVHDRWISFLYAVFGQYEAIDRPLMQYRRYDGQQIGPGASSLSEKLARASVTGADFYREEILRFRQLDLRLELLLEQFPQAQAARHLVTEKIAHLEHRAVLPHSRAARVPGVLRELLSGGYSRSGSGWKSAAKDLLMKKSLHQSA